jgi:hypothetical protein
MPEPFRGPVDVGFAGRDDKWPHTAVCDDAFQRQQPAVEAANVLRGNDTTTEGILSYVVQDDLAERLAL